MASLEVIIVGAGLGGLACAIACRRAGLEVTVYEKTATLQELGAGILLTPNASRIMQRWDLLEAIKEAQAFPQAHYRAMDAQTGEWLFERPGPDWARAEFGACWYHMHRADYQRVLASEATRLGAILKFGVQIASVDGSDKPSITLSTGEMHSADLVVGADGVASLVRETVAGTHTYLKATGDVAYRALIPKQDLVALDNPLLRPLLEAEDSATWTWFAPGGHSVFYPVRDPPVYNLVILLPDDLPEGVRREDAEREQMQALVKDWNPFFQALINGGSWQVAKWKIEHMEELPVWSKGAVVLIGDASHPTPPYQAQGAALAVEDGATLGVLLGLCCQNGHTDRFSEIIDLFVELRKKRTALQLRGALGNRDVFHMKGSKDELTARNAKLQQTTWDDRAKDFPMLIGNMEYMRELNGHDAIQHAEDAYRQRFMTPGV